MQSLNIFISGGFGHKMLTFENFKIKMNPKMNNIQRRHEHIEISFGDMNEDLSE